MTRKKMTKKASKKTTRKTAPNTAATQRAIAAAAESVAPEPAPTRNGQSAERPEPPVPGTQDQRMEATQRAEACNTALDEVLTRFRCRLVPVLNPTLELVGGSPTEPSNKGMVSCTYGVAPLV